jgi:hypothetical protein
MTGALQMATQIPKIHIIAYIPVLPKVVQWGNFNKQIFLFNFFMEMQMEMAQIINVVCRFKFAQIKSPGYIGSDPLWSKD